MGDMCDIPNYKRTWYRRLGVVKILVVAAGVLLAALVWGRADEFPAGVSVEMQYPMGTHGLIGSEFQYNLQFKNNEEKTVKIEAQVGFYVGATAECAPAGSLLTNSFSTPQTFFLAPNDSRTISGSFTVMANCEIPKANPKIFLNATEDGNRSTKTIPISQPISVL